MVSLLPTKTLNYHRRWYQTWPVWHTCTVVITCCSGFASFQFYFAISACEWQTAKPRTGKTICFSLLFCKFLDSCLHWLWRWLLSLFFRSSQWPTLVRLKGLLLHVRCIPQQNSQWQFWASVSVACIYSCSEHLCNWCLLKGLKVTEPASLLWPWLRHYVVSPLQNLTGRQYNL